MEQHPSNSMSREERERRIAEGRAICLALGRAMKGTTGNPFSTAIIQRGNKTLHINFSK